MREKISSVSHEICVDIDLTHIVDNDGDAFSFTVIENVIEKCRLSRSKKTRKNGDRKFRFHDPRLYCIPLFERPAKAYPPLRFTAAVPPFARRAFAKLGAPPCFPTSDLSRRLRRP